MKRLMWLMALLVITASALLLLNAKRTSTESGAPVAADANLTPQYPSGEAPRAAAEGKPSLTADLQVRVVNEAGDPIREAEVRASARKGSSNYVASFKTDNAGNAAVAWPVASFDWVEVSATKEGFAGRKVLWEMLAGDRIPSLYLFTLRSGIHAGGSVVDPDGNPISDATVTVSRNWLGEQRYNRNEDWAFLEQTYRTGPDGRWTAQSFSPELLQRVTVVGSHTNFITGRPSQDRDEIARELQAGTLQLVLEPGAVVAGRVVDEGRQPIVGATVLAWRDYTPNRQQRTTDAQGRFTFRNLHPQQVPITATADGYISATQQHDAASTNELLFQLVRGYTLRGVVQEEDGDPLDGVSVRLYADPGERTQGSHEFSTMTRRDGAFEWRSAPLQRMTFHFYKAGFQETTATVHADRENTITLRRNRIARGIVVDADTGNPVTQFSVQAGMLAYTFTPGSKSPKEFAHARGEFMIEMPDARGNALQVTAKDYADTAQTVQLTDEHTFAEFRLKRGNPLEAVLVTPDGQPVAGTTVMLSEGIASQIRISRGQLEAVPGNRKSATTDANGRFSIASPNEAGTVIAGNEFGIASATVQQVRASGVLALQPLGRIEGVVLRGSEPLAGQALTLNGSAFLFDQGYRAETDAQGRFSFEQVPAGPVSVARLVKLGKRAHTSSHGTDVTVQPGQTTTVTLGGVDATLRGQVRLEDKPAEEVELRAMLTTAMPAGFQLSKEQIAAYFASPEYQEFAKTRKQYSVNVGADGSLLVDSVAPGQYKLIVSAVKANDPTHGMISGTIAQSELTVTIPDGSTPGAPIDIGEVVLKPRVSTRASVPAP